jgi:predicted RNA-binding protein
MSVWLVSIAKDNYEILEKINFRTIGISDRYIKTLAKVRKGDFVIIYLASKISAIPGLLKVEAKPHAIRKSIWLDNFYNTIDVKPVKILKESEWVDVRPLLKSLSFVSNKLNWGNYFRQSIKQLEKIDYKIFEKIFRKKIS